MAKSGGRRKTTARLFVYLLVGAALPGRMALAQRLELRAGAVASSALVSDAIARGASPVKESARPAPLVGAALVVPLRHALALEAGAAYAFSALRGKDSSGSWTGARVGVPQLLV
ncbi:MAG TPA: hypothetical protein VF832_13400, partial [Longimicrobiales bacterium]